MLLLQQSIAPRETQLSDSIKKRQVKVAISEIKGYLKAARIIMVVTETDKDIVRTFIMILSFGVEKSLKALIRCIDGKVPPRHHELDKLFDLLSKQSKGELIAMCGAKPRHIQWALSTNKNSFEKWRYIEEADRDEHFFGPQVMLEIMEYAHFRLDIELKRVDQT